MWTRAGVSPPTATWGTGQSTVETICTRWGGGGWPLVEWLEEIAAALEEGRCLHRPDEVDDRYNWPALTGRQGLTWIDPRDPRLFPDGMIKLDGPG